MALTITSTNSRFVLSLPDVFPVPQFMQGYAVDDAFEVENITPGEARLGVDAHMSAAYLPYLTPFSFMLQADSLSVVTMDGWLQAMNAIREVLYADATVILPAIQKIYVLTKGVLTGSVAMPSAKKALEPQKYQITFESCVPGPYLGT